MTDRFLICLPFTLKQEGGDSNDPHDPGGRTHKGIVQREYDAYRKSKGLPLQSDYLMSDEEVQDIYRNQYWMPHCPELQPGLDLSFFDNCVNEGPRRAIILLQRALDISADGIWGPQTTNVIANIKDVRQVIRAYAFQRASFYRGLSTFQYFGKGWLNRTSQIEQQSLAMVS